MAMNDIPDGLFISGAAPDRSASSADGAPYQRGPNWARRRDIPLAILGWFVVVAVIVWLAQHVAHTLLLLAIAALLAYALIPAVNVVARVLPRWLAILLVYLAVLLILAGVVYLIIQTAVSQISGLSSQITNLLSPGKSPLYATLHQFGITTEQITQVRNNITSQLGGLAGSALPYITGFFSAALDVIVVAVLSIYFLVDGPRVARWFRNSIPIAQRQRGLFLFDTIERVVGGYIRGELLLCSLVGVLVGGGMWALGVHFAVLLGVLAFIFEFIPFLGPFFSAAFCVVAALANPNPLLTVVLVLAYFILIHIIEGYLVGPRILGRSVGLHPAIALIALIAFAEIFGFIGALFAAPIAGLIQALIVAFWIDWRKAHPEQFPTGHTVTPGIATVPVVTPPQSEPATPTVEPGATPQDTR